MRAHKYQRVSNLLLYNFSNGHGVCPTISKIRRLLTAKSSPIQSVEAETVPNIPREGEKRQRNATAAFRWLMGSMDEWDPVN